MISETYVSELNENTSIYGVIAFLGKINDKNRKPASENKIEFKLGKVHTKTLFSTPQDNALNLGEKRAMSHKIVDTVHTLGLLNFEDYRYLNPIELTIDLIKIIETLSSYKKYRFRFIFESLLFSTNFLRCSSLKEAKTALLSSKLYKIRFLYIFWK